MPLVLGLLAALSAIAYRIYRRRSVEYAVNGKIDLTEDPCGVHGRKRFLQKAEVCPIAVIDDPAVAATAMLVALASSQGALSLASEEAIKARCAISRGSWIPKRSSRSHAGSPVTQPIQTTFRSDSLKFGPMECALRSEPTFMKSHREFARWTASRHPCKSAICTFCANVLA
jgi:hypothetical protein